MTWHTRKELHLIHSQLVDIITFSNGLTYIGKFYPMPDRLAPTYEALACAKAE